jgi:hypothetical protein
MFMALGALVIIGVLVAASSFITMQETRLGQNQLVQSRAFTAAEYGLNKIQQDWDRTPNLQMPNGASYDTSYALAGQGTATVRYTRLNDETFWIVSEGVASLGSSATRTAKKRVGAILRLRIPTIKAEGAITAGGNVVIRGGADINGANTNPPGWGSDCQAGGENKAGVVVPPSATVTTQGSSTVSGDPPWRTDPLAADQNTYIRYGDETWNSLVASANIVVAGGAIGNQLQPSVSPPLIGTTCNRADIFNWGEPWRTAQHADAVTPCNNYFPIIYSSGDLTLNGSGRGQGLILVNGNVTINGHFEWHGLIVVSNDIVRGTGSADIYGGVMARNEVKADESIISGTTTYNYSSCALERAMRGSAQVVQARQRAWTELF